MVQNLFQKEMKKYTADQEKQRNQILENTNWKWVICVYRTSWICQERKLNVSVGFYTLSKPIVRFLNMNYSRKCDSETTVLKPRKKLSQN